MNCPCGSNMGFEECCEPFMLGKTNPETAEQLMRSRYTAYVQRNIPYLKSTLTKRSQRDFDAKASKEWAEGVEWLGLTIVSTEKGGLGDNRGIVEFAVKYKKDDEVMDHHEVSRFERNDEGDWKFHDGDVHTHKDGESCDHHPKIETYVRDTPKIGRNDPCSCGSGKKFKKCCA